MTATVGFLFDGAAARLAQAGLPEPRRDAAELVARVLGVSHLAVLVSRRDTAPPAAAARLRRFVARRARRVPLDYVLGDSEFMGLTFAARPGVFVPRPETELLVEDALSVLRAGRRTRTPFVAEAGTGSGCIAISLAVFAPRITVWATEISRPALRLARANAARHGVGGRVRFFHGDLLAPLLKRRATKTQFDLVAANPPYVPAGDVAALPPEVRQEPRRALDGGVDGLDAVRRLADQAAELLRPGGVILLEIGSGQGAAARAVLEHRGYREVTVRRDLAGHDRIVRGVRPATGAPAGKRG